MVPGALPQKDCWRSLMRIREILESASVGATASGAVATVAQPLGSEIMRRVSPTTAKYKNAAPRNTPTNARR